jgi:acetyl esterase
VVGVHGGAWTSGDRLNNAILDEAVAASGAVVMAVDFRLAPQFPYPAAIADINFGIRWLKANAARLGSRPDWVGAVGSSSGGHQMLLTALRPLDAHYAGTMAPDVAGVVRSRGTAWPGRAASTAWSRAMMTSSAARPR